MKRKFIHTILTIVIAGACTTVNAQTNAASAGKGQQPTNKPIETPKPNPLPATAKVSATPSTATIKPAEPGLTGKGIEVKANAPLQPQDKPRESTLKNDRKPESFPAPAPPKQK